MLRLTPNDVLKFSRDGDCKSVKFCMLCISKFPISYKIQTVHPEKFYVRPRCGLLFPKHKVLICIALKREYCLDSLLKDKFLVMSMPIPLESLYTYDARSIEEFWKSKTKNMPEVNQQLLYCAFEVENVSTQYAIEAPAVEPNGNEIVRANDLEKRFKEVERGFEEIKTFQVIILYWLLLLSIFIIILLNKSFKTDAPDDQYFGNTNMTWRH